MDRGKSIEGRERTMGRFVTGLVAGALAGAVGMGIGLQVTSQSAPLPACPVEDSCEADYRDGAWWVREGTGPDPGNGQEPGAWHRVTG